MGQTKQLLAILLAIKNEFDPKQWTTWKKYYTLYQQKRIWKHMQNVPVTRTMDWTAPLNCCPELKPPLQLRAARNGHLREEIFSHTRIRNCSKMHVKSH
jgi:hypothetical protein